MTSHSEQGYSPHPDASSDVVPNIVEQSTPVYREFRGSERQNRTVSNLPLNDLLTRLDQVVEEETTVWVDTSKRRLAVINGGAFSKPADYFTDGDITYMYSDGIFHTEGGTYIAAKGTIPVEEEKPSFYVNTTMTAKDFKRSLKGIKFTNIKLQRSKPSFRD